MTELKKRLPGRPISENKLTSAQKQAAYRDRQRSKIDSLEVNHNFTCDRYDEQKIRIEQLEVMLKLTQQTLMNETLKSEELQAQVWALEVELSKRMKKSNVTKIYKQVDIED